MMRVVLASKSPARLQVLRAAGLDPEVIVSGFDETTVQNPVAHSLAAELAKAKGSKVAGELDGDDVIVMACDTTLEFEGRTHGKPRSEASAIALWHRMRGHNALLHTGHYVFVRTGRRSQHQVRVGSTRVHFADITDDEVAAYAATGEPVNVAGGFSINGLGGAFVTSIVGDPYNVVGISLPLVRQMVTDLGVAWHTLWTPRPRVERP